MSLQPVGAPAQAFPPELGRWPVILTAAAQLAERIADTEFVPKAMRGKPEVVVAAIMYGDEIGIGPMQALAGIDVVEGRPRPNAELLRALILRAGHSISVHDMSLQRCRLSGLRAGRPEAERVYVEWTLDMARAAGLAGKQNWRQYPRAMLLARATSDLARAAFPDVVRGLGYVSEVDDSLTQLESWAGSEVEPGNATQQAPPPEGVPDSPVPVAPSLPARPSVRRQTMPKRREPAQGVDLDDLRPEPQPPEPPTGPRERPTVPAPGPPVEGGAKVTDGPLRAIHAKVGKLLPADATRAERLALLEAIIGGKRRLESSSDLTRSEGYAVLEFLAQIEQGRAWFKVDDTGAYVVGVKEREQSDDEAAEEYYRGTTHPLDPWADPAEREAELKRELDTEEGEPP